MKTTTWTRWIFALALAGAACAQKTINDVLADPARYANKEVTLSGHVVESYSIAGKGFYSVEDSTGRLWVFSSKGVPREGADVKVTGKIHDGFDLSSLGDLLNIPLPVGIKERVESGLLMVASSHKVNQQ